MVVTAVIDGADWLTDVKESTCQNLMIFIVSD